MVWQVRTRVRQKAATAQAGEWAGAGMSMTCSSGFEGTIHDLWRAVDQNGQIVDILVQSRRDSAAAEPFFHHLLKRTDTVSGIVKLTQNPAV